MTSPLRSALRAGRAVAVAAVVVSLAAGAHVAGGGALPHPALVVALLAGVALVSSLVTRRRLGTGALVAVLGASQVALHTALDSLSGTSSGALAGCGDGHEAHAAACAEGVAVMAHDAHAAGHAGPLMLAAHVVAVVLAALVLAGADRALFALVGWLAPLVRPAVADVVPRPAAAPVPSRRSRRPHQPPALPRLLRRGPPAGPVAAPA